jgi:hypothetical protein
MSGSCTGKETDLYITAVAEAVNLLLILEVLGSKLGLELVYPDRNFHNFFRHSRQSSDNSSTVSLHMLYNSFVTCGIYSKLRVTRKGLKCA